ncbi:Zinc finger protein rst2 [Wickerhamiella sorbophila]|uniref:Zinc finger protein rst2 n=1 Tax=Wickerhamiella sorbophila TaxID=45607 RepID=A0A2T0FEX6_9ASCO|nr:Zinc finger protein rst2 [Wickerhamiella sorbophila]PRT53548.1 Zinc finger protein rst2 [Wickerhamiella sorbophila]
MPPESSELRPSDFLNAKGRFKCSMCVNTYRHFKHLKRHLNSHTHEVIYECEDCGRRFSRGDLLQRHRRKCSLSDEEMAPSYRIRRTRARRTSSTSTSTAGDSDVSDSIVPHSDSEYGYEYSEAQPDLSFVRRSGRHTMHPQTYEEDTLASTRRTQGTPLPLPGTESPQQQHQQSPHLPTLNYPQRIFDQQNQLTNQQTTADWISRQVPQTPPEFSQSYYHPEQSRYENSLYSSYNSTEPGWLAPGENEISIMDFSNPVSPAWESVDNRQYANSSYPRAEQKPSTDMYSDLYFRDPVYDTGFMDQNSYSSPIIPADTDFSEFQPDLQWSNPTSRFVYQLELV